MTASDVTQELPMPESGAPPGYPRSFGQYLLLCPLAHGGMGEVFLASSRGTAGAVRLVVIKTLRPDLANEPGYVNRFLDEARIVIQLQHANICQVFDVGKTDGAHFFAMEHIAGTNIRRLVDTLAQAGKSLPPSIALYFTAEVLEGLDAAHRHRHPLTGQALNVVHRDVSPHNIMVGFEGDVKVIDFGLAASDMKMEHTESQVVMGKIAYMSPEQARGEPVDASSDQFSAGIMLYELLVGERYYGDLNQREIWSTAGSRGYVPPRWGQLDDDVAGVLRRALGDVRKERFPTCGEFASALRAISQRKYPYADKAMVRSFVREAVANELEASEKTLRSLGTLAMTAMPSEESRAMRTVELRAPSAGVVPDAGTGSTRTFAVFGAQQRGSKWLMPAMTAFGGLAIGALVVLALPMLRGPAPAVAPVVVEVPVAAVAAVAPIAAARIEAAPVEAAPIEAAPIEAAPVEAAPVAPIEEAPVEAAAVAAEEAAPVVDEGAGERARNRADKKRKRAAEEAAAQAERAAWSEAKKLDVVSRCDHKCAKMIGNLRRGGTKPERFVLDDCVEKCARK